MKTPLTTTPPSEVGAGLLTVDEAAEVLRLKRATLYGLTSRRRIPHIKRCGRLFFERDAILAWLREGKREVIDDHKAAEHITSLREVRP